MTGIYDTYFRGYDPSLGWFMQVDPLAIYTHSLTSYHYAGNNPVMMNDPSGALMSTGEVGRYTPGILGNYQDGWTGWSTDFGGVGGPGSNNGSGGGGGSWLKVTKYLSTETEHGTEGSDGEFIYDYSTYEYTSETSYVYVPDDQTQNGSGLYSDETAAYRYMWNNSFRDGEVWRENYAWLTNKGVLVLPTEGLSKTTGKYQTNEKSKGYTDYLSTKKEGNNYLVQYNGAWLTILGSIHTHPNNSNSGLSGADANKVTYGPAFVFDNNYLYAGFMNNGSVTQQFWKTNIITDKVSVLNFIPMFPK